MAHLNMIENNCRINSVIGVFFINENTILMVSMVFGLNGHQGLHPSDTTNII